MDLGLCGRPSVSSCVCSPSVGPLLVKDEYDYDNQQSHSSSESHLQTIQHPPSRPGPQETFSSPSLLPPAEGSSSASTSAFSTISAGPSSETLHLDYTSKPNQNLCTQNWLTLFSFHTNRSEPQLEQEQQLHPGSASASEWTSTASSTHASHRALL